MYFTRRNRNIAYFAFSKSSCVIHSCFVLMYGYIVFIVFIWNVKTVYWCQNVAIPPRAHINVWSFITILFIIHAWLRFIVFVSLPPKHVRFCYWTVFGKFSGCTVFVTSYWEQGSRRVRETNARLFRLLCKHIMKWSVRTNRLIHCDNYAKRSMSTA